MQHPFVVPRLSVMMFLQFFVWGAWYVTVGNYMREHNLSDSIGWAYSVGPIAAIVSPLFLGMIADRYFPSERVLGFLHIVGGAVMFVAPHYAESQTVLPTMFIGVLLIHMLCYMPTLSLTNTLAFHNMSTPEKQFPLVRVFGTIGWIAANFLVSWYLEADKAGLQFYIAGGSGILLGLYSLTLPHTPAPAQGQKTSFRSILGLDSLALMKEPSFAIFIVSSFLICAPLAAYFAFAPLFIADVGMDIFIDSAGVEKAGTYMLFGQIAEILFMLIMPFCFARLGIKWMLLAGMLAWVLRYALFALGAADSIVWMIMLGILLHGICYDFYFVTGFIYVDQKVSKNIRGQAQGLLVLVTQGLGMLLGAQIAQSLKTKLVPLTGHESLVQWGQFWWIPCAVVAVIMVFFLLFFRERNLRDDHHPLETDTH